MAAGPLLKQGEDHRGITLLGASWSGTVILLLQLLLWSMPPFSVIQKQAVAEGFLV